MDALAREIEDFIVQTVTTAGTRTKYRRPLVGFASADDPRWQELRRIAEPSHFLPQDLLPEARTVVAFFLPFAEEIVRANREADGTAPAWATAYLETNALINQIVQELIARLGKRGIRAAGQPATYNWDPVTLISRWSHKSAAAVAGLGTFGLHRMLITDAGCAGRCGSLVIDAEVPPTSRSHVERCLYFYDGSCTYCVDACPVQALRPAPFGQMNLDKWACHAHLRDVVKPQLGADCCGKCAVGPCALASAVK
jgi:epoxyqueuosine reductase